MIVRAGDHAISSPRGYRADSTIANRRRHPFSSAHRYCRRPRSVSLHVQASTFSPRRWTSQSSGLSATARGVQDSSFPAIAEAFYGRPAASAHRFPICSRRTPLSPGCPKIPDTEVREFNSGNRDLLERRVLSHRQSVVTFREPNHYFCHAKLGAAYYTPGLQPRGGEEPSHR